MNIIQKHTLVNFSRGNAGRKYIVIHYTGNRTDTAAGNANYFYSAKRKASAHYFVDEKEIYEVVDPANSAWAVGKNYGKNNLFGKCKNTNSISIEMCSTGGKIADATISQTVELTKYLMQKYGIASDHVVRHYDVCSKQCPGWSGWLPPNETLWKNFKARLTGSAQTVTIEPKQAPASQQAQTAAKPSGSQLVRDAQGFIHNFVDGDVKVDGIRGAQTNKGVIQVLQRCIDLDYGVHLAYDGIAGAKTLAALGKHYVKRGEKQYLVSFVEVALSALNYDPTGIENPGIFGSGLENAVKVFQRDAGLTADGVAGYRTLRALIAKF